MDVAQDVLDGLDGSPGGVRYRAPDSANNVCQKVLLEECCLKLVHSLQSFSVDK